MSPFPTTATTQRDGNTELLRIGIVLVTAVYIALRLIVDSAAIQFESFSKAFTNNAGYLFGWKISDAFHLSNSWGKVGYVLSLVITYGLLVLSVVAIIGLVRDARSEIAHG
jgi:hypothetical protein